MYDIMKGSQVHLARLDITKPALPTGGDCYYCCQALRVWGSGHKGVVDHLQHVLSQQQKADVSSNATCGRAQHG